MSTATRRAYLNYLEPFRINSPVPEAVIEAVKTELQRQALKITPTHVCDVLTTLRFDCYKSDTLYIYNQIRS